MKLYYHKTDGGAKINSSKFYPANPYTRKYINKSFNTATIGSRWLDSKGLFGKTGQNGYTMVRGKTLKSLIYNKDFTLK